MPAKAPQYNQKQPSQEDAARSAFELARLMPPSAESSRLVVVCRAADYSASQIARAVEDCDAHLLNLNVTAEHPAEGLLAVDLRIDRVNPASVVRSLERYGYTVSGFDAVTDQTDDETRRRIAEFLRYIDV